MIGESTPIYVGVLQGQTSWNDWFTQYFQFMQTYPVIKAFDYINANWALTSWPTWGDSQIEDNSVVNADYAAALADSIFLHQQSSAPALQSALGL